MKVKNNILFTLAICLISVQLFSQTALNKTSLEVNIVKNEYTGDYGSRIFNFKDNYFGGGLTLNRYMSPAFDFGIESSFGNYGYFDKADISTKMKGYKLDINFLGTFKLNNGMIFPENRKFTSFLCFGVGLAGYMEIPGLKATGIAPHENPMIITQGIDLILPVGIGFSYKINQKTSIHYKYQYTLTTSDNHDVTRTPDMPVYSSVSGPDAFGKHSLGISLLLGNNSDDDNDGIDDKIDLCFGTPQGAKVDDSGCPLDSDKDGVEDFKDKCNNTPDGVAVNENGCPLDSDNDGVYDYLDKCGDTPSKVKVDTRGCPVDTDKDGVPDYLDKCNDTPKGVEVDKNGCVNDSDLDGVPDFKDLCPCTPENIAVTENGCPVDTDCDGVADYLDKCPDVKGTSPAGCPGITSAGITNEYNSNSRLEIKVKDKILEVEIIRFNTESGKIDKTKSDEQAEDIASYLQQFKVVKVKTDNGRYKLDINEINKKLSASGSKSKAYLLILKETP